MKNLFLKNKKLLIFTGIFVSCIGYNIKSIDSDSISDIAKKIVVAKKATHAKTSSDEKEFAMAYKIMQDFKSCIESFFADKNGKQTRLKDIEDNFKQIIVSTKKLIAVVESKQKANPSSEKYEDFLTILKQLNEDLQEMVSAISKRSLNLFGFLKVIKNTFSKFASKEHIAQLKKAFNKLKSHNLNKKEETHLNNIVKTIDTLFAKTPNKAKCFIRLSKLHKRK